MNRTLLTLALIILVAGNLQAQQINHLPEGKGYFWFDSPNTPTKQSGAAPSASSLSDDFEGPSYNIESKWEILRSSTMDFASATSTTSSAWFHCTAQSFSGNGAAFIKNGTGSAAIPFNAPGFTWLVTRDTISVPQSEELYLKFWLYYYSQYDQGYITHFYTLAYDIDSHKIDTLKLWGDNAENSQPNRYDSLITLPLNKLAGKNIRIAFVYENRNNNDKGAHLAIDNVTLTNHNSPDIAVTAVPFPYTQIPYFLFDSVQLKLYTDIVNLGAGFKDTVTLTAQSSQLTTLASGFRLTDSVPSGKLLHIKLDNAAVFKSTGDYSITITSSSKVDTIRANNTDSLSLTLSDALYATDSKIAGGFSLGAHTPFGNIYPIQKEGFIRGIQIGWSATNTIPEDQYPIPFAVTIYRINPSDSTATPIYAQTVNKEYSDIGEYHTYNLDETVYCLGEFSYFATITQADSRSIGVGFDGDPYGSFWKLSATGNLPEKLTNSQIGNAAIRLVFARPVDEPIITFTAKNASNELAEGVKISIPEIDTTLVTNAEGKTTIKLANGFYSYQVDSSGYAEINREFRVFSQDLFFNITLQKAYRSIFEITDTSGKKLEDAYIYINRQWLVTGTDGTDSIFLASGSYPFSITAKGYATRTGTFDLTEKDTLVTFELTPDTTYTLTVKVNDTAKNALEGASVSVWDETSTLLLGEHKTDTEGVATFNAVGKAPLTIRIQMQNFRDFVQSVQLSGDSTLIITLTPEEHNVTFFVSCHNAAIANAQIILNSKDTVTTGLTGYATYTASSKSTLNYAVKVKGFNPYTGTIAVSDRDIRVNVALIPVGVAQEPNNNKPLIYPNPVHNILNIEWDRPYSVSVYNLAGKLIYTKTAISGRHSINLSGQPNGLYIVKQWDKNRTYLRKIIKH